MDLVVVDGPNLFNSIVTALSSNADEKTLRAYFACWFDVDRLVLATIGAMEDPQLGVVIFHSRKPIGKKSCRLEPQDADAFWGRQGTNPNTSCILVDIPGGQQ